MKIGVIGTIWLNTPPKKYGGTEEAVYNLVNGLTKQGHDVTLFGPKTAKVNANIFPTVDKPLREANISWTEIPYNLWHVTAAFDQAKQFDILHMHLNKSQDYVALPLAMYSSTPVLFTFHFLLPNEQDHADHYQLLSKYKALPFTSISNSQRGNLPLNFIATVYHALDLDVYKFQPKPDDYLVWIGKINPLKGTKEAILAAKKAQKKLLVLGAVEKGEPELLAYYQQEIKPLIDNKQIIWVGEADISQKVKILGKAKAFLNPIVWKEPFGLVMIESQATGTPVISFAHGAAPELIVDKKTGFLVDTLEQMIEKIDQIDSIDRSFCRKHIEKHFSIGAMIQGYEKAYTHTIEHWESYRAKAKGHISSLYQ